MTIEDRLFDPRDYGGKLEEPRRRKQPEGYTVVVSPPWVVLQRLKASPVAHRVSRPTPNAYGGLFADCGAKGLPMSELDGMTVPACERCFGKASK